MELATDSPAVKDAWTRIERGLEDHAPGVRAELHAPVADGELEDLERSLGLPLPPEMKASWRLHDGTSPGRALLHGRELLSARGMRLLWQRLCRGGTRGRWNPAYLPFAADGLGDFLCLDLGSAGRAFGRVVEYWPDRGHVLVVAASFRAWLESLAGEVEQPPLSRLEVLPPTGHLRPPERDPAPGREARQARDLLSLLAERDLLVLRPEGDLEGLTRAVASALAEEIPPPTRAGALAEVLLAHPAVDEVFVDDETLAAILEAW